jgi:hypothetical protein
LKMEKTGLGLFTGLAYQIGSKGRIDVGTELGMKRLEGRLYNQSRYKDNYMRGLVGGVTSLLVYAAFLKVADEEEYRKWRAKNKWAARYLDTITPEHLLAKMAIEDGKVKQYAATSFNKNDAFDATGKLIKAAEFAAKGDKSKAWGALGEAVGQKVNAPLPWRLVKDGQVIYQGATGQDPYHGNYKPSEGFLSGVLQNGVIEYLGYRPVTDVPEKTFDIKDSETFKKRQATKEENEQYIALKDKTYANLLKNYQEGKEIIWVDVNGDVHIPNEENFEDGRPPRMSKAEFDSWTEVEYKKLTPDQTKQLDTKAKARAGREAKKELFGDDSEE